MIFCGSQIWTRLALVDSPSGEAEGRGAAPQIELLRRMFKIPGKFYAPQYTKGYYEGLVKMLESW